MKKSTKVILWIASVCVSIAVGAGGTMMYYSRILRENTLPAKGKDIGTIEYTVDYFVETWGLNLGVNDFEIDKETAMRIGDAVLLYNYGDKALDDSGYTLQNTEYRISETSDGKAYYYTRYMDVSGSGGGYCVLISKQNGQIIGTWIGE